MHLINVDTLSLETFVGDSVPPYAILSHTWGANHEEISFEDIQRGNIAKPGNGTKKLKGCCNQAKEDHLRYAWIDTCCIDKKSSLELEEAINSMFQWYRKASVCYAYLSDVPSGDSRLDRGSKLYSSRWFQRGWTLQELLAPKRLRFYDQDWTSAGTKASISGAIEAITGISRQFLLGWVDFRQASVAQRMSWAANRQTSRREDTAYCLLGIFDVTMPMIYGEGDRALSRLQQEIMKTTGDHSILAWGLDPEDPTPRKLMNVISTGILATAPSDFANCRRIVQRKSDAMSDGTFNISGGRLKIHLSLHTTLAGETYGLLNCGPEHHTDQVVGIPVQKAAPDAAPDEYFRPQGRHSVLLPRPAPSDISTRLMRIHMERQSGMHEATGQRLWLYVDGHREVNLELGEFYPTVRWENERAVVLEAGESEAYTMRRYSARFRTHGQEQRDVIVVLEFEMNGMQPQARCHVMTLSRDTALEYLNRNFMYMRPEVLGKQAASIGTLHVEATLEEDWVAQEPVWVLKFDLASGSLSVPVDANLELGQVNLKREYLKLVQRDDQVYLEAERWTQTKDKEVAAIDQMRERLATVEQHLRKFGEEKKALLDGIEKRQTTLQQADQLMKSLEEAGQQQAERSKRQSEIQRHLDETNRGHGDWLETHISAFLNASRRIGSSEEAEDSDNGRSQLPKGGGSELNTGGQTPLSWAAMSGQVAIVKLLLARGADMEAKDGNGRRPISLAAENGHEAVVGILVEKGANVETKDNDGRTPVSSAAEKGHEAVVRLLLEKGANMEAKDNDDRTPVSLAAYSGHEAVVRLLLEKGANMETKDNDDRTPVSLAAYSGHEAVVRLLLEKGANMETKDNDGDTPISLAACNGYEAVVRLLLEKGANMETKDNNGRTPVSLAAYSGHEAVVRLLLEKGANMEAKDNDDRTPVSLAAYSGHEAVVRLLLDKGANMETKDNNGRTPVSLAAYSGHEAVVRLLLDKGANMETKDNDGRTPVSLAAYSGHEAVVRLLLDKGANMETKDNDGEPPMLLAVWNGHMAVVKLLIERWW